ncbi:hypothetical protein JTB14_010196 [Gonioctena quinquepunctata]|nr:hypothetical protein JTB14_010196 [Gonioctena quinquepunctata]
MSFVMHRIGSSTDGYLFEQRLNVLKNLKTLWANDVAIVHINGNQTQFYIGSNDEVIFESENQVSVEHSEGFNDMVLQNNTKQILILKCFPKKYHMPYLIRSFCTEEALDKTVNLVKQKLSRVPSMETYSLCRIV